jgi:hypothetical protein
MPPAGQTVSTPPADHVPLAADDVAQVKVVNVRADFDDPPYELVPDNQRDRDRSLRPVVPVVDVHVGAADPRAQHLDQHIVDADLRLGHVLKPQADLAIFFNKRFQTEGSGFEVQGSVEKIDAQRQWSSERPFGDGACTVFSFVGRLLSVSRRNVFQRIGRCLLKRGDRPGFAGMLQTYFHRAVAHTWVSMLEQF